MKLSPAPMPDPQPLALGGHVAGMAADPYARRGVRLGRGGRLRDGVRVQVASSHRTALLRQLPDQLTAHARAAAGDNCELSCELLHRPMPPPARAAAPAAATVASARSTDKRGAGRPGGGATHEADHPAAQPGEVAATVLGPRARLSPP